MTSRGETSNETSIQPAGLTVEATEADTGSDIDDDTDEDIVESALEFDVDMLKQLVSNRLKRCCINTRMLTKGLYNEIHLLRFEDNGPDCIARLSRDPSHPADKLASEVATMKYVAQNTNIRVPEVYDWDSETQNDIKVPYILMEYLPGTHLYRVWDKLNIEQKRSVLSQIVDVLSELWKCKFEKIGCIYKNSSNSARSGMTSTNILFCKTFQPFEKFRVGPIVSPLFYIEGRNDIPDVLNYTGPFGSNREWFCTLIRKEKQFFTIHGVQELIKEEDLNDTDAKKRVEELKKNLELLQSKLSKDNVFDDLIDKPPFVLIHGDFDAQNMLVDDNNNIIGIIDWEFSRTGTLWDICKYPIWIQEVEELRVLNDAEVEENRKKKELRDYFRQEMVAKLGVGDISGQILDKRERDRRIEDLEAMFTLMVHRFDSLEILLKCFFDDHYKARETGSYSL
jgi:aminoglycoside phosphotransferase